MSHLPSFGEGLPQIISASRFDMISIAFIHTPAAGAKIGIFIPPPWLLEALSKNCLSGFVTTNMVDGLHWRYEAAFWIL